ncbi:MAG: hypothetical protein ACLP7Q_04100 [Isosphaeraceae bacterium]
MARSLRPRDIGQVANQDHCPAVRESGSSAVGTPPEAVMRDPETSVPWCQPREWPVPAA